MSAAFDYIVENWSSFLVGALPGGHKDDFEWPFDPTLCQPLSLDERRLLVAAEPTATAHLRGRETALVDAINGFVRDDPPAIASVEIVEVPEWAAIIARGLNTP